MDAVESLRIAGLSVLAVAWGSALLAYMVVRHGSILPWNALLTAFGLGGGAAFVVALPGIPLFVAIAGFEDPLAAAVVHAFVAAGLVEEAMKALVVLGAVIPFADVRRPADAVAAAVAVALGFGVIETLFHFGGMVEVRGGLVFGRLFAAIPAHLVDGLVMGAGLAWAMARPRRRRLIIFATVVLAAVSHGAYDAVVFVAQVAPSVPLPPLGPALGPPVALLALMLPLAVASMAAARWAAPEDGAWHATKPGLTGRVLVCAGGLVLAAGAAGLVHFAVTAARATPGADGEQALLLLSAALWWPFAFGVHAVADGRGLVRQGRAGHGP